jgi:hypothetical protein
MVKDIPDVMNRMRNRIRPGWYLNLIIGPGEGDLQYRLSDVWVVIYVDGVFQLKSLKLDHTV